MFGQKADTQCPWKPQRPQWANSEGFLEAPGLTPPMPHWGCLFSPALGAEHQAPEANASWRMDPAGRSRLSSVERTQGAGQVPATKPLFLGPFAILLPQLPEGQNSLPIAIRWSPLQMLALSWGSCQTQKQPSGPRGTQGGLPGGKYLSQSLTQGAWGHPPAHLRPVSPGDTRRRWHMSSQQCFGSHSMKVQRSAWSVPAVPTGCQRAEWDRL